MVPASLVDGKAAAPRARRRTLPVSVVIITRGRLGRLKSCLDSLEADASPAPLEVLVVVNGRDPETLRWLRGRAGVRCLESFPASKGGARNLGARTARGEYVLFLDDDATAPEGFFAALEKELGPEVDVLGGPNLTPPDSGPFQRAAGAVLRSRWGAGPMARRYDAGGRRAASPADDRSLMLCNLVVRRRFFAEGAAFRTDFFYNEENVLLEELRRRGAALRYSPALAVHHARRGGWKPYLAQVWRSGVGRGHMTRELPGSFRPLFAAPSALLLFAVAAPLFGPAGLAPLAVYAAVTAFEAVRLGVAEGSFAAALRAAGLFAGGHLV
jgi:glycosyltransferase involved in cell wall biosynthesis